MDVTYNSELKKQLMREPEYGRKITPFKIREFDEFFSNSSPQVFIGSKLRYPAVNGGVLSPPERKENVWMYNDIRYWADHNFNIDQVLKLRGSLINSRFKTAVDAVRRDDDKLLGLAREIGMSAKPVDTEIKLKKKIKFKMEYDDTVLPVGSKGSLERIKIGNTKIPSRVDKVYFDTDMKAVDGLTYLSRFYDENKLIQLLSIGVLGVKKKRVLVPTRWSITATHSMLGNNYLKKVKEYPVLNEFRFFYGHYLGNYYFILFFPEMFNYELFETYLPGSSWNPTDKINMAIDFEPFKGRTNYAKETAGGFYATRLGILEYLSKIKRQASVLVIRVETPEYYTPLGVWVVLSAIRKTLINEPYVFDEKTKAIEYFKKQIFDKFKLNVNDILKRSKLLDAIAQRRIFDF